MAAVRFAGMEGILEENSRRSSSELKGRATLLDDIKSTRPGRTVARIE